MNRHWIRSQAMQRAGSAPPVYFGSIWSPVPTSAWLAWRWWSIWTIPPRPERRNALRRIR